MFLMIRGHFGFVWDSPFVKPGLHTAVCSQMQIDPEGGQEVLLPDLTWA